MSTAQPATRCVARLLLGLLLLWGLTGCASNYTRPSEGTTQRGVASWYGKKFHGRQTASGETYDMYGFTAAHRELPLGTWIEVRHLENDRKVRVRVNDRGPFVRGRILDLSYGAAKELGMIKTGTAKIELRVVDVGEGRRGDDRFTRFAVQLGAFGERANAEALLERYSKRYPEITIRMGEDGIHRVWIIGFTDRGEADKLRRDLVSLGQDAVVIALP